MLPPKMKLDIVIKTKHKENMNIANTIVVNASFYVWSGFLCLLRIFDMSRLCFFDVGLIVQQLIAKKLFDVSGAEITAALAEFRFF